MGPLPRLAKQVSRPPVDDIPAVVEVMTHHFRHGEDQRLLPDQRDVDNREVHLQRRVPVQLVDHDVFAYVPLALDDQPHRILPVGLVADVAYLAQPAVLDARGDPLRDSILDNPIGDLVDDDTNPAASHLLGVQFRPNHQRAAAL